MVFHWAFSFKRKLAIRLLFQFKCFIYSIPILYIWNKLKPQKLHSMRRKVCNFLKSFWDFRKVLCIIIIVIFFKFDCAISVCLYLYRILYLNGMCFSDDIRLEYSVVYFVFCGIHVRTIWNGNVNVSIYVRKWKYFANSIVPLTTFQLFMAKQCEYSGIKELPSNVCMNVW